MSISFSSAKNVATGINANHIATGDLNGDGQPDLLINSSTQNQTQISVLLGSKNGRFGKPKTFTLGPKGGLGSIATGDFDHDGHLDVATTIYESNSSGMLVSSSVMVLSGDGTGRLESPARYLEGTFPVSVATGDFNGDGQQDLVVTTDSGTYNPSSWGLTVLLNDGTGGFTPTSKLSVQGEPDEVAVGDFNGDGKLDIAATSLGCSATGQIGYCRYTPLNVSILLNDGSGKFTEVINSAQFGGFVDGRFTSGGWIVTADFNGDGKLDAISELYDPSGIGVLLGNGTGALNRHFYSNAYTRSGVAGDFNSDGQLDLVTVPSDLFRGGVGASVLLGDGSGRFSNPIFLVGRSPKGVSFEPVAADFNHDGKLDIATANGDKGVSVWFNTSRGKDALILPRRLIDASSQRRGSLDVNLAQGKLKLRGAAPIQKEVKGYVHVVGTRKGDRIQGNQEANRLQGIEGNDVLIGLNGKDVLSGGAGNDTLMGGQGADKFVFSRKLVSNDRENALYGNEVPYSPVLGIDQIQDFTQGTDKILLDTYTFVRLSANYLRVSFASVKTVAAAKTNKAVITYVPSTGRLYYNENRTTAGFGAGGLFAEVDRGLALTAKDFLLISGAVYDPV